MSAKVSGLVWERAPVKESGLLVMLALADFANAKGENVYPSIRTLADMTRTSRSTVKRQLRALREQGLIAQARESRRGQPTTYRIDVERLSSLPPVIGGSHNEPPTDTGVTGEPSTALGVHREHVGGSNGADTGFTAMTQNPKNLGNPSARAHVSPTGWHPHTRAEDEYREPTTKPELEAAIARWQDQLNEANADQVMQTVGKAAIARYTNKLSELESAGP